MPSERTIAGMPMSCSALCQLPPAYLLILFILAIALRSYARRLCWEGPFGIKLKYIKGRNWINALRGPSSSGAHRCSLQHTFPTYLCKVPVRKVTVSQESARSHDNRHADVELGIASEIHSPSSSIS